MPKATRASGHETRKESNALLPGVLGDGASRFQGRRWRVLGEVEFSRHLSLQLREVSFWTLHRGTSASQKPAAISGHRGAFEQRASGTAPPLAWQAGTPSGLSWRSCWVLSKSHERKFVFFELAFFFVRPQIFSGRFRVLYKYCDYLNLTPL